MKLVIFDMDGLMFDTETVDMRCFKEAAKEFGYELKDEFLMSLIGMNESDTFLKVKKEFGENFPISKIRALTWEKKMAFFYQNGLPMKKGLKELLEYLKKKEIKLAVASSSPSKIIEEYLTISNMENVFDYIMAGDRVEHSKPDPEIFLKVLEHFGFSGDEALVLEDSDNGILASYRANIPVICVPDIVNNKPEILAYTYKTLPSLLEAKEIIEEVLEANKC